MKTDFIQIETLEELKNAFSDEIQCLMNDLAIKYDNIAEHTIKLENLQQKGLNHFCDEIDKGISANDEFRMHCEVLSKELDGIETLAKNIHFMRKYCEEMEKKLMKIR